MNSQLVCNYVELNSTSVNSRYPNFFKTSSFMNYLNTFKILAYTISMIVAATIAGTKLYRSHVHDHKLHFIHGLQVRINFDTVHKLLLWVGNGSSLHVCKLQLKME